MLVLNCCKSNQVRVRTETAKNIYFPEFPLAPDHTLLPLDFYGKRVKDIDTEIVYIQMPYWYWKEIVKYATEIEEAVQALQNYEE